MSANTPKAVLAHFSTWIPGAVQYYLAHKDAQCSLRALAREDERPASTVSRQVRRLEKRRDDLLIGGGLDELSKALCAALSLNKQQNKSMTLQKIKGFSVSDEDIAREGKRILRRLCEPRAVLAVSREMKNAIVMRLNEDGKPVRTAVTTREMAQIFALKEWIICTVDAAMMQYGITSTGRKALKRMLALGGEGARSGVRTGADSDCATPFAEQHREWGKRALEDPEDGRLRYMRYNIAETPMLLLARRKSADGVPFLSPALVDAGEKLREDFEVAQIGPKVGQNWDKFLTGFDHGNYGSSSAGEGSAAARARFDKALAAVGPGLRDILLRCCCHLEGLEAAERGLGWSARSGKIVLRIALEQLHQHYSNSHQKVKKRG